MLITIRNEFHNTEARVQVDRLPAELSTHQRTRLRWKLCGVPGCTCGTIRDRRYCVTETIDRQRRPALLIEERD